MTVRFDRPISHSARFSRRIGRFSLLMLLVVLVAHRVGWMETPYFIAFALIAAGMAVLAVLLGLVGLIRLWQVGAEGGVAAAWGLIYAVLPLALVSVGAYDYFTRPALYDISTDLVDAPPWLAPPEANQVWLTRYPAITAQDREAQFIAYPALTGRRYEGAMDRIYQAVTKVTKMQGITIVKAVGVENAEVDIADLPAKSTEEGVVPDTLDTVPVPLPRPDMSATVPTFGRTSDVLLQGQIRTLVLGLRFDVMIRLREEVETTLVDIRVASRYGPHDLGVGADIADEYLRALDAELLGIAGG